MLWLYILLGAVAFTAALLACPTHLSLVFGEKTEITLRYLFFKKTIFPSGAQKKRKKKKKSEAGADKKQKKKSEPKNVAPENVFKLLGAIKDMTAELVKRLKKRVKITLINFRLVIRTDEAAKTAELYGAACVLYDEAARLLRENAKYDEKAGAVTIVPDFSFGKTEFDMYLDLKATLLGIVSAVLPTVMKTVKYNSENINRKGEKRHG